MNGPSRTPRLPFVSISMKWKKNGAAHAMKKWQEKKAPAGALQIKNFKDVKLLSSLFADLGSFRREKQNACLLSPQYKRTWDFSCLKRPHKHYDGSSTTYMGADIMQAKFMKTNFKKWGFVLKYIKKCTQKRRKMHYLAPILARSEEKIGEFTNKIIAYSICSRGLKNLAMRHFVFNCFGHSTSELTEIQNTLSKGPSHL